jgi:hypothetical protein
MLCALGGNSNTFVQQASEKLLYCSAFNWTNALHPVHKCICREQVVAVRGMPATDINREQQAGI